MRKYIIRALIVAVFILVALMKYKLSNSIHKLDIFEQKLQYLEEKIKIIENNS